MTSYDDLANAIAMLPHPIASTQSALHDIYDDFDDHTEIATYTLYHFYDDEYDLDCTPEQIALYDADPTSPALRDALIKIFDNLPPQ